MNFVSCPCRENDEDSIQMEHIGYISNDCNAYDNSNYHFTAIIEKTGHLNQPMLSSTLSWERKGKEEYLYSAIYTMHSLKALRHRSHSFTCKIHHACLSFVSIHQMAPPLTEVGDVQLQLTAHLSTPKGWKAELAWLIDILRTVYRYKWSPISYRSSVGEGKFTGQDRRSTAVPLENFVGETFYCQNVITDNN